MDDGGGGAIGRLVTAGWDLDTGGQKRLIVGEMGSARACVTPVSLNLIRLGVRSSRVPGPGRARSEGEWPPVGGEDPDC